MNEKSEKIYLDISDIDKVKAINTGINKRYGNVGYGVDLSGINFSDDVGNDSDEDSIKDKAFKKIHVLISIHQDYLSL